MAFQSSYIGFPRCRKISPRKKSHLASHLITQRRSPSVARRLVPACLNQIGAALRKKPCYIKHHDRQKMLEWLKHTPEFFKPISSKKNHSVKAVKYLNTACQKREPIPPEILAQKNPPSYHFCQGIEQGISLGPHIDNTRDLELVTQFHA